MKAPGIALLMLTTVALGWQVQPPGPKVAHKKGQTNQAIEDRMDSYWKRAQQEVYKSPEELTAQRMRLFRHGIIAPTLMRGDVRKKWLALTFDDGPHPQYTEQLLAILAKEKVPATFFVVGFMAERYPNLIKEEDSGGHLVENHTFSHVTLTHLPEDEVSVEYRACDDVIQKVLGKKPQYCRPPGGDYDRLVVQGAGENGLTTVLWTDDPGDYASPGTNVIERDTLRKLQNGGIILLHDGVEQTVHVLPQIIEYAKRKGFTFVTVDEMMKSLTRRQ